MMKGNDRYQIPGLTCTIDRRTLPVVNLSVGGVFVESTEPLPLGQTVTALLGVRDGVAFEVTAKVVWINEEVRPRVAHLPPGFGLKIQRMRFRDRMEILRVLGGNRRPRQARAAKAQPAA
jgi:Tfp pilus assembly protein PilZ